MFKKYEKIIEEKDNLIKTQDEQYQDVSNELYRVKRAYQNLESEYEKLFEKNEKNIKKIKELKKKAKKNE